MVSAPGLGLGRQSSILCFPTHGSLAQREEHPVEARGIPVRFRGEPPCRTRLTARHQSSKLVIGVQFPGTALERRELYR